MTLNDLCSKPSDLHTSKHVPDPAMLSLSENQINSPSASIKTHLRFLSTRGRLFGFDWTAWENLRDAMLTPLQCHSLSNSRKLVCKYLHDDSLTSLYRLIKHFLTRRPCGHGWNSFNFAQPRSTFCLSNLTRFGIVMPSELLQPKTTRDTPAKLREACLWNNFVVSCTWLGSGPRNVGETIVICVLYWSLDHFHRISFRSLTTESLLRFFHGFFRAQIGSRPVMVASLCVWLSSLQLSSKRKAEEKHRRR